MSSSPNPEIIRSMFSKVAAEYDKANSVLSVGIHHLWRKKLVQLSEAQPGQRVLDCATGTGDLAIEFKKSVGTTGKVIGTDFCPAMLTTAPAKAKKKNLEVQFEQADVTQLQYSDHQFDIVSISFGIRNVGDPVKALQEMARVCKPGGRIMVLEFGQMRTPVVKHMYKFYSEKVLPVLGGMITGQKEAYEYLQTSSAHFPCREGFISLMKKADCFSEMTYTPVSFGIAYIYTGIVK
ncbi:MAG: bifunctional demethylmenaquinone methyltransferase/2-methoxy-6-polyprenyl-1,4-benzoquinol methylase UbiE [Bdellovibrionaceae bacterium]|nr:bifunctional demethylmenaquinone methyltransferase/2-methoxy-6-polyprenyl-1,4-benzoquinol methylase UbiE [Bdellovibrio sp.]